MANDKFKLRFPLVAPERIEWVDMDTTLQEIKLSQNCFVLYAPYDAPAQVVFTKLDEELLLRFIVMLGQHPELANFLKSALVCHEKLCKSPKKGVELIHRAVKFVREHVESFTPNDDLESE